MDLYEMQDSAWEYVSIFCYILLAIYLVIPFVVGFVVAVIALFLSVKFPSVDQPTCPTPNLTCSSSTGVGGMSLLLKLQRKQRNEYFFQSVSTLCNNDSLLPMWILKDIFYDFFKPYTTVAFERILVVIPSIQTLMRRTGRCHQEKITNEQASAFHFEGTVSNTKTAPSSFTYKGPMERGDRSAVTKLTYLDLSLTRYCNSSQNFYKEKRPIYFKFWRDP